MAFQQYNSAALKKRREKYEKRLKKMTTRQSKKDHERQKKYGFMLGPPNVIPNYMDAPTKKGEGNRSQDKKRTGSIYTPEPKERDDRMSPALKEVFFRPIKGERIDPSKVMILKPQKHTPRSARYAAEGRRRTAKIYRKKKIAPEAKRSKSAAQGGRRKRRKQRGGNTPICQTTPPVGFTYAELENREGETFHVKAPETDFMNDGNYRLEDYGIDGQGGEGEGLGLVGVNGGANGDFHVDADDITNHRVRICKLDHGDEEKRQAGGRRKRKRRRKTRKNKRSKKRRGKKRKTHKTRKKIR